MGRCRRARWIDITFFSVCCMHVHLTCTCVACMRDCAFADMLCGGMKTLGMDENKTTFIESSRLLFLLHCSRWDPPVSDSSSRHGEDKANAWRGMDVFFLPTRMANGGVSWRGYQPPDTTQDIGRLTRTRGTSTLSREQCLMIGMLSRGPRWREVRCRCVMCLWCLFWFRQSWWGRDALRLWGKDTLVFGPRVQGFTAAPPWMFFIGGFQIYIYIGLQAVPCCKLVDLLFFNSKSIKYQRAFHLGP